MRKNDKINNPLEQIDDVSIVMNFKIFIYLDLFLLSFFLGFLLYSQIHHWLPTCIISSVFFLSTSLIFKLLITKDEPQKKQKQTF